MKHRTPKLSPAMRTLAGVLALFVPTVGNAADASGPDAHGFNLVTFDGQPVGLLTVQDPFVVKGFFGGGLFEYAASPFVRAELPLDATPDQIANATWSPVLDNVVALNLNTGYAFNRYLRLDVGAPVYLTSTGLAGESNGTSIGDVRVAAFGGWSAQDNGGFGIGVVPFVDIPSGDSASFLGQGAVAGGAKLTTGYKSDRFLASVDAGAYVQPDISLDNLAGSDLVQLGAGIGYAVTDAFGLNLESHVAVPLGSEVSWAETPAELIGHATYQLPVGLSITGGGSGGLTQGVGAAQYRLFLGLGYSPVFKKAPPIVVDLDADDDGINDDVDACVTDPETVNSFKDSDGCPDALSGVTAVGTVDGQKVAAAIVLIGADGQPKEGTDSVTVENVVPGTNWKATASYLCYSGEAAMAATDSPSTLEVILSPKLDAKAAIEAVYKDGKPVKNAIVKWDKEMSLGCVPKQIASKLATGTGEVEVGAGKHRVFITADGANTFTDVFEFKSGQSTAIRAVLEDTRVKVEAKQIVILDKVFFETDSDVIKADSFKLLDEVGATIMANPQIGRVAIEGHTDSDGDDAHNLDLSKRRAESVKRYMEGKGVKSERLVANGYGETKPIAKNTSASGKAKNRRVEFNLIDQAPPPEPAPVPGAEKQGKSIGPKPAPAPAADPAPTPGAEKQGTSIAPKPEPAPGEPAKVDPPKSDVAPAGGPK